jgi:hypothetical protein
LAIEIPDEYGADYITAFGLIEAEWNQIETILFLIFTVMSGMRVGKCHRLYFSQINHRARREMVESIAPPSLARLPRYRKDFIRLMRRLKRAAQRRNEVIHTLWFWQDQKPNPAWPLDHAFQTTRDILKELQARLRTIRALRDDMTEFYVYLNARKRRDTSLGRRPPLGRRRLALLAAARRP